MAQVANVICELLQSAYFGVGNATAMLIGETLGQGNKEEAFQNGKRAVKVVMILNVFMTILMILVARPVTGIYHFNGETNDLLVHSLIAMAITLTPKMLGYIFIVGTLRAGGDTLFCMKVEIICNLLVQVPLAFFSVLVLKVSLPIAMLIVAIGDVGRVIVSLPRFKNRKWINIVADIPQEND